MKLLGYTGRSYSDLAELTGDPPCEGGLKTRELRRKWAIGVSCATVIFLCGLGIFTLAVASQEGASSGIAFGVGALLDCLSSLVVMWRFYERSARSTNTQKREYIACICLGVFFVVSAFLITAKSSYAIHVKSEPEVGFDLMAIAVIDSVVCLTLAVIKAYLGWVMESWALKTDAVNSFVGALLAVFILLTEICRDIHAEAWLIDPIMGLLCAVFLFLYGASTMAINSITLYDLNKKAEKKPEDYGTNRKSSHEQEIQH